MNINENKLTLDTSNATRIHSSLSIADRNQWHHLSFQTKYWEQLEMHERKHWTTILKKSHVRHEIGDRQHNNDAIVLKSQSFRSSQQIWANLQIWASQKFRSEPASWSEKAKRSKSAKRSEPTSRSNFTLRFVLAKQLSDFKTGRNSTL